MGGFKSRMRLGLMGGTFNPVHDGHLFLAEAARREASLDAVLFIPTGSPPHKQAGELAPAWDRYRMVELALKDMPGLIPSRLEVDRQGTTYTVDTLRAVREHYGDGVEIFFIIGADTLLVMESWKDFPRVAVQTDFIVAPRSGISASEVEAKFRYLRERYCNEYIRLNAHVPGVSSTQLRSSVHAGNWQGEGVPAAVANYILETGLYAQLPQLTRAEVLEKLKTQLDNERIEHILGVEKTALELANRFGAPLDLAARAALLHDCAKVQGSGHDTAFLASVDALGLSSEATKYGAELVHGQVGAAWARKYYGEQHPEVLDAIACHTTGKPGMSVLDKVVCLADMIEPGRDYPGVEELRALAQRDLDAAILLMFEQTVTYVMRRRLMLYPPTVDAYNSMLQPGQDESPHAAQNENEKIGRQAEE